jgi:hypothetical protein
MKTIEDLLMEFMMESSKLSESTLFKDAGQFGQMVFFQALLKTHSDKIREHFKGEEAPRVDA